MKTKIIKGIEYEMETHDYNKTLSEIKIPKGWRLLKPSEALMIWELEQLDDWFFVEQVVEKNKDGKVARFNANSVRAILNCNRDPELRDSCLGVRFCRDLKKKGKN